MKRPPGVARGLCSPFARDLRLFGDRPFVDPVQEFPNFFASEFFDWDTAPHPFIFVASFDTRPAFLSPDSPIVSSSSLRS